GVSATPLFPRPVNVGKTALKHHAIGENDGVSVDACFRLTTVSMMHHDEENFTDDQSSQRAVIAMYSENRQPSARSFDCPRLCPGFCQHYGFDDAACAFFDFFAELAPNGYETS